MNKDEARDECLAAIRYVAGGLIHPQEAMEKACAYAQAAVDEFKADTLGMLEWLARRNGWVAIQIDGILAVEAQLEVAWSPDEGFEYLGGPSYAMAGTVHSRTEAAALLKEHADA